MRKHNSNKSKLVNGSSAVKSAFRPSNARKRASNENATLSREFDAPTTRTPNSTWRKALNSNPEMRDCFQKALDAEQAGRFMAAARIMEAMVKAYPQHAPLWWYLGGIYLHDLKRPREAMAAFRHATRLAPLSERASLGLFHSLWDSDLIDEALAEIKRYQLLTNWSCEDYREIVEELAEKWTEAPRSTKQVLSRR